MRHQRRIRGWATSTELAELRDYLRTFQTTAFLERDEFLHAYTTWKRDASSRDGRRATERILGSVVRFIIRCARRYVGQGVPLVDLVQVGAISVIQEALPRFEPERGYTFLTYAQTWIHLAMRRTLIESGIRAYRLPVHVHETLRIVWQTMAEYHAAHQSWPTALDLLPAIRSSEIKRVQHMTLPTLQHVMDLLAQREISLHERLSSDDDQRAFGDLIASEGVNLVDRIEATRQTTGPGELLAISRELRKLTSREQLVIVRHFGLDGRPVASLADIGKELQLTRERIRQIKVRALKVIAKGCVTTNRDQVRRTPDWVAAVLIAGEEIGFQFI